MSWWTKPPAPDFPDRECGPLPAEMSDPESSQLKAARALCPFPQDVTTQSVLGFDPLPPLDTIYSYVRPERYCFAPGLALL